METCSHFWNLFTRLQYRLFNAFNYTRQQRSLLKTTNITSNYHKTTTVQWVRTVWYIIARVFYLIKHGLLNGLIYLEHKSPVHIYLLTPAVCRRAIEYCRYSSSIMYSSSLWIINEFYISEVIQARSWLSKFRLCVYFERQQNLMKWHVKKFSKMKASHVILVSYPVFFVHINIDCCSCIIDRFRFDFHYRYRYLSLA
jgi:hypothetical protein